MRERRQASLSQKLEKEEKKGLSYQLDTSSLHIPPVYRSDLPTPPVYRSDEVGVAKKSPAPTRPNMKKVVVTEETIPRLQVRGKQ